jgi:hypothetical protein
VTDFPQVLCYLIAVGTFPLEADTSFKVVGCPEYILHNIWELLTDFSALPTRTAFWVHIEFKIEQIRRKTLYIKIKDRNPSIKSTRQMRAQVDTTQKKKKGVKGKLENCATIGGSSRCSTQDWRHKMEGKYHEGYAKTFRLRDKTTLLHLVITQEIIRVKWVCQAMWLASFTTLATPFTLLLQHLLALHHSKTRLLINYVQLESID